MMACGVKVVGCVMPGLWPGCSADLSSNTARPQPSFAIQGLQALRDSCAGHCGQGAGPVYKAKTMSRLCVMHLWCTHRRVSTL